jgi:HK97 family phage major capsid protein
MPGEVSTSFLNKLSAKRSEVRGQAEQLLLRAKAAGRQELLENEEREWQMYRRTLRDLDDRIGETRTEIDRIGTHPLMPGEGRAMSTAGRLAPLEFGDEEMRRLQVAAQRGETCRIEHRDFSTADSLLPAQLFPFPIEGQHEGRILDRLPGYAMETASITFIRHVSTTGVPTPVAEGAAKPELVFHTDQITEPARKLAAHNGLSWEIINDWPAFQSYCGGELYKQIIDVENDQILNGTGVGLDMTGFFFTSGILTEDATAVAPDTAIDHIEKAIAKLRTGPALGVANLLILHPSTWSAVRRTKDGFERYLTQADPTVGEASSVWGVPVLSTTACPAGNGLLLDTTKFGYVAVREPLSMRVGYSGDDLVENVLRTVAEERLVLCTTRAPAVLSISNLPVA